MRFFRFATFFCVFAFFCGCTVERAEEQVVERHANGVKKTSVWVYPEEAERVVQQRHQGI